MSAYYSIVKKYYELTLATACKREVFPANYYPITAILYLKVPIDYVPSNSREGFSFVAPKTKLSPKLFGLLDRFRDFLD